MVTLEKLKEANDKICSGNPQWGTFTPEEVEAMLEFINTHSWEWRGEPYNFDHQSIIMGLCIGWVAGQISQADDRVG